MKKSHLKIVYDIFETDLNNKSSDSLYNQWYFMILDFIECRIYKNIVIRPKMKRPKNICKVHYINKGIEFINLPRISTRSYFGAIFTQYTN